MTVASGRLPLRFNTITPPKGGHVIAAAQTPAATPVKAGTQH